MTMSTPEKADKKDPSPGHPYLTGNFAPIQRSLPLTPCAFTGVIPPDLAGGQYVRNGGNPLTNTDLGREAHWFDGDGMLSGVLFRRVESPAAPGPEVRGNKRASDDDDAFTTAIQPEFVNQYLLTDLYLYARGNNFLRRPILPSIATLVSPATSLLRILLVVLRAVFLVIVSRLPGGRPIKKISVANTSVLFHDGRALATCESGPPLRFALPGLDTIGWFDGVRAENEVSETSRSEAVSTDEKPSLLREHDAPTQARERQGFGGGGSLSWMREWTTAHPRVDPETHELISFHSMFVPPYVRYSVVQPRHPRSTEKRALLSKAGVREAQTPSTFDTPVAGITSPKMMHDFGVSKGHTVILDLPLTLNPLNPLLHGVPSLNYDAAARSRFGVFPRHRPDLVRWFETKACVIFHTANCWDTYELEDSTAVGTLTPTPRQVTVNLLACRLTSASLIFSAGNLPAPVSAAPSSGSASVPFEVEEEQCRLYYYAFTLPTTNSSAPSPPRITHQWALSTLSFEFPTVSPLTTMRAARYVYGCTTNNGTYTAALGKAAKIDHLAKFDVAALIARGKRRPPEPIRGSVDTRSAREICSSMADPTGTGAEDDIRLFALPTGCFAQEPRFVPRGHAAKREDDGWLLTYVFDEAQLDAAGNCPVTAQSELWIIDAREMREVVARVILPQRVPYGLHGAWFSEEEIQGQIPWERLRRGGHEERTRQGHASIWDGVKAMCERWAA